MTTFNSPLDLAHALQTATSRHYGLLLHNKYQADASSVWLLPDRYEQVAHHRAKFGVWPWSDHEQVFVQWCVEKGVEGKAASSFDSQECLGQDWAWWIFLERAKSIEFDKKLAEAVAIAKRPLIVRITLDTATPGPSRDYLGTENQTIVWRSNGKYLELYDVQGTQTFVEDLQQVESVKELAEKITQSQNLDWCWIDFGVGVILPLHQDIPSPDQIWQHILQPWADWV